MKSSVIKRSIDIGGHKTSVSLEDEFWDGLRAIAERQNMTVSALTKRIDNERQNRNLSSAIRVFVFKHFQGQAVAATESEPAFLALAPQHDGIGSPA
jgi:predicted DNA-binding ribbon-helix-helix protein